MICTEQITHTFRIVINLRWENVIYSGKSEKPDPCFHNNNSIEASSVFARMRFDKGTEQPGIQGEPRRGVWFRIDDTELIVDLFWSGWAADGRNPDYVGLRTRSHAHSHTRTHARVLSHVCALQHTEYLSPLWFLIRARLYYFSVLAQITCCTGICSVTSPPPPPRQRIYNDNKLHNPRP